MIVANSTFKKGYYSGSPPPPTSVVITSTTSAGIPLFSFTVTFNGSSSTIITTPGTSIPTQLNYRPQILYVGNTPQIYDYTINILEPFVIKVEWDTTSTQLKMNANSVVLHGFSLTTTENTFINGSTAYSFSNYDYYHFSNFISLNTNLLDQIISEIPQKKGVLPAVRIPLNAGYYLNVFSKLPQNPKPQKLHRSSAVPTNELSLQYQTWIEYMVTYLTSHGVICILDLHWNDDTTQQQPMALKDTTIQPVTGDSKKFWSHISKTFRNNGYVWYELYNEPYINDYLTWSNGNDLYWGMIDLYNTIRKNTNNPIVIAGSSSYAYDSASLIQFDKANPELTNVIYNFHPYMGSAQKGDPTKAPVGFENIVTTMQSSVSKPLIITEFGQYCCVASGACYQYPGTYNGIAMGYSAAILTIAAKYNVSWTIWAWKPNIGPVAFESDPGVPTFTCKFLVAAENNNPYVANYIPTTSSPEPVNPNTYKLGGPTNPFAPAVTCDDSSQTTNCGADIAGLFSTFY